MAKRYFNFRFKYRMIKGCKLKRDIKKSLKTALSYNSFWSHWIELPELKCREHSPKMNCLILGFINPVFILWYCSFTILYLCFSSFDTFFFPFTLSFPFIKSVTSLLVLMEALYTLLLYSLIHSLNRKSPLIFIMGAHRIKVFYGVILSTRTIHLCWSLFVMDLKLFALFVFIAKVNFAIIITIFE